MIQCDRFGHPRPSRSVGLRTRKSRKCGCQWQVIAALEEGKWLLRQHRDPKHRQHNHGPSIGPSEHPSHRKITTSTRATIEEATHRRGVAMPARDVQALVQELHPETALTRKDIHKARAGIKRDKFNGLSTTGALIELFNEQGIPYVVQWEDTDQDLHLSGLVWTFPYCIRMWKCFPEVVRFGISYGTNRFNMPLLEATGQTGLRSIYNVAFGVAINDELEGFQFLAEGVRQLAEQHSIRQPEVIITESNDVLQAAVKDKFHKARQELCIYDVNYDVLLEMKQKWVQGPSSSDTDSQPEAELSLEDQLIHESPTTDIIPHPHTYKDSSACGNSSRPPRLSKNMTKRDRSFARSLTASQIFCDISPRLLFQ